jgi:hypothetical protein
MADQRQISFSKPAIRRDKRGTVGIRQVTTQTRCYRASAIGPPNWATSFYFDGALICLPACHRDEDGLGQSLQIL